MPHPHKSLAVSLRLRLRCLIPNMSENTIVFQFFAQFFPHPTWFFPCFFSLKSHVFCSPQIFQQADPVAFAKMDFGHSHGILIQLTSPHRGMNSLMAARHPNYFGEIFQWWFAWALAYHSSEGVGVSRFAFRFFLWRTDRFCIFWVRKLGAWDH